MLAKYLCGYKYCNKFTTNPKYCCCSCSNKAKALDPEWRKKNGEVRRGRSLREQGHEPNCTCCICKARRGERKGKQLSEEHCKSLIRIPYNRNFFSRINNEVRAYWLGYLYADGSVYVSGSDRRVELLSKDRDIFKFAKAIRYPVKKVKKIKKDGRKYYEIVLSSKQVTEDLIRWGCIPNKARRLKNLPSIPKNLLHHFVRGFFDGDGGIYFYNSKYLTFNLCGSKEFLENIQQILINKCRLNRTKFGSTGEVYTMIYSGNKQCVRIFRWLYNNATVYMSRKKNVFDKFLCRYSKG